MTDDARTVPLPSRPNGEGQGTARVPESITRALTPTTERDLWMLRRRALIQEVKAIEQYLGIDKRPGRLMNGGDMIE